MTVLDFILNVFILSLGLYYYFCEDLYQLLHTLASSALGL